MLPVPTGSTTVPQLPDPFVPRIGSRIADVLTGLPAEDQEPSDSAWRSVPQTPRQGS
jgi:hypothetical protein